MKVKGTTTTIVSAEIDVLPEEMYRALKAHILQKNEIPIDSYLYEGKIVCDHEYHTSHCWGERVVVDEHPSDKKIELLHSLKVLYKAIME